MKLKKDVVFSLIVSLVLSFVNLNVESNNSDIILSNDYIAVSAENSLKTVVPCGQTIGVTLSTDGVIVVNLSKIL